MNSVNHFENSNTRSAGDGEVAGNNTEPATLALLGLSARAAEHSRPSTALVVDGLRPRQVIAASLLASGKQGRQVAATLGIAPETLSRWKAEPEFQNAMRQLLREHIDSMQLGMIALTGEAIGQLHNLLDSFSDAISLKACALVLRKAAPIIGVIGEELRRPERGHL